MLDFIEKVSAGYYVKVFPRLRVIGSAPEREIEKPEPGNERGEFGPFGSLPRIGS
jgi:hypothetical protein